MCVSDTASFGWVKCVLLRVCVSNTVLFYLIEHALKHRVVLFDWALLKTRVGIIWSSIVKNTVLFCLIEHALKHCVGLFDWALLKQYCFIWLSMP